MFGWLTLRRRVERLESKVKRIQQLYQKTLSYRDSDPETALMNARKAAEAICSRVFEHKLGKSPKGMTLKPLIERLTQIDALPESILVSLRTIQGFGNLGSHHQPDEPTELTPKDAEPCLAALGIVVQWYFNEYGSGGVDGPIVTTPRTRSAQHNRLGNASPWIAIVTVTAAVAALLLAGVATWNTRTHPRLTTPPVPTPPVAATISPQAKSTSGQDTGEPGSSPNQAETSNASPAAQTSIANRPLAGEKPRIAVLPFQKLSDGPDSDGLQQGISTVVASRLEQSGVFDLVERSRLDAVLAELELSQDAKFDPAQAVKIGKLLGAKQLVVGSFFPFGDKLRLDARLIDTETGRVMCSAGRDGAPEKIDAVTTALCDALIAAHPHAVVPTVAPPDGSAEKLDSVLGGVTATLQRMFAACNAEDMTTLRDCLSSDHALDSYDFSHIDAHWSVNDTYCRLDSVDVLADSDAAGARFTPPHATVRATQTVIQLPVSDERNEVFHRRCREDDRDLAAIAKRLGISPGVIETTSVELLFKQEGNQWKFVRTLTPPTGAGVDSGKKQLRGMGVPFQLKRRS